MKEYQQRVVDEKKELQDRLVKLDKFLSVLPESITKEETDMLKVQMAIMSAYCHILNMRIKAFNPCE